MKQLAAAGAPASVAAYEDAEAAANVFSAISPQCLAKFELLELLLPGGQQEQQEAAAAVPAAATAAAATAAVVVAAAAAPPESAASQ